MQGDRMKEIARRIESRPWNRPGTDKTQLLQVMWDHRVFQREVAKARHSRGLHMTPLRLRVALGVAWIGSLVHRLLGDRSYRRLADFYRMLRGRPKIWTA